MAIISSGTTIIDNGSLTDGIVVAADLASNSVITDKIASSAVTDAKIDGMSSSKLSGALPAIDGSALTNLPSGGAGSVEVWVRLTNTGGTPTVAGSGNVSSVSDNGTGRYTVNFSSALSDVNYAALVTTGDNSTAEMLCGLGNSSFALSRSTTSCRFYTSNKTPTFQDKDENSFIAIR